MKQGDFESWGTRTTFNKYSVSLPVLDKYYINKKAQSNGDHEVHKEGCEFFPSLAHALYLGVFTSCHEAVDFAKRRYFEQSNGCYTCSAECNEG